MVRRRIVSSPTAVSNAHEAASNALPRTSKPWVSGWEPSAQCHGDQRARSAAEPASGRSA